MDCAIRLIYTQLLRYKHGVYHIKKVDNNYEIKFSMIHKLFGCIPMAFPTSVITQKKPKR